MTVFFFKQKTAYEIGLGIPAEPLFRSSTILIVGAEAPAIKIVDHLHTKDERLYACLDRKSGSAGMPRPISYAVFCLKKKKSHLSYTHSLTTNYYHIISIRYIKITSNLQFTYDSI